MENTDLKQKITCPWGSWDLNGNWYHNPNLEMTKAQQLEENIRNGYMDNATLKDKYDKMHRQGADSWFDDGTEERNAIIEMGAPWHGRTVMEIGCGEGELMELLDEKRAIARGCDYSLEAITTAKNRFPYLDVMCCDWTEYPDSRGKPDVIVMQGVLEHLDDWQAALDAMILKFEPKTIITSMPCFLNIRGIVWHTLDMLGAVMSKTDLHFINDWDVCRYCDSRGYKYNGETIDLDWGSGKKMVDDLQERIPLALSDGGLPLDSIRLSRFLLWLDHAIEYFAHQYGAVAIYRIDL